MEKLPLLSLPYPSTAQVREPVILNEPRGLLLLMACDEDGQERRVGVLFIKPRALRKRAEIYCTIWHINKAYDTVCEVTESSWVAELKNDAVSDWRDRWVMRHFMIYLDSFGCLEVVAESVAFDDGNKNLDGTCSVSHTPFSAK